MNTHYWMTWHRLYSILYSSLSSSCCFTLSCNATLFLLMLVFFLSPYRLRLLYSNSSPLFLPPSLLPFFCLFMTEFSSLPSFTLSTDTEFSCYSSPSLQTILQSLQWLWEALVPTLWSSPTSSSSPHVWAASSQGWLQAQEPVRWQTVRLRPTSTPVPQGGLLWTILV